MGTKKRKDGLPMEQLVLPKQCHNTVLHLAYDIPLAGHLGKGKTSQKVLERFYWPTLYRDVANFCKDVAVARRPAGTRGSAPP